MPDYSEVQFTRRQAAIHTPACPYTIGDGTYARKRTPTFEYKSSATGYTGGGYPRIRSRERRGHTPGDGTDDVFVAVHRLAAVVWCYDGDRPLSEITADLRERDVHHELEMPAANLPAHVEVVGHGEHSRRTNTAPDRQQQLAWAKDAKREQARRQREDYVPDEQACTDCGAEVRAAVAGEQYCLDCATTAASGTDHPIEML